MTQYVEGSAEILQIPRCIVSDDYRTITVPAKERTLGCVGDDETRRVWFDMPLSNDGISLADFDISIHYVNAAGNTNRYDVSTAYTIEDRAIFSWLVQRGTYEKAGLVSTSLKMRKMNGDDVVDEYNSTIVPFTVKPAHDYNQVPQPEQEDYIAAFIAQQTERIDAIVAEVDDVVEDAQTATTAATDAAANANAAATSATTAAQSASQAATAANSAATNASQAATDATDAAERAEQAAEGVESAIDAATAAATSANSAAATASTAAANADSKAALATQAASTANQAAQAAESATTAANTAAGQATTAAGNATTAAQSATTAATNADAKAQLADTAAANADTATANANTATANANTATTAANNAATAANNAAEYAIDAADDMPKLSTTASGTTAQTVNDAWPTTPESAVLYGKCVQDGTPTPDNPVDMQVVGGRNLLIPRNHSTTVNGVTFTDNGDDTWTLSGTATATADYVINTQDTENAVFVQPGAYNFSAEGLVSGLSAIISGGGTNGYPYRELTVDNPSKNGIATSAKKFNYIMMRVASGTTVNTTTVKLQLESGTTATPFTPYGCIGLQIGETVTPIDLQGHTLAGLPDGTRDVLRVDSAGRVWIEKLTRTVVFDGVNKLFNREYAAGSTYKEFYSTSGVGIGNPAMVSSDTNNLANMAARVDNNRCAIAGIQGSQVVYWRIPIDVVNSLGLTSSEALNTFLQSNPLEITGKLATPQEIELGTITPPSIAPGDTLAIYASLDPEWAITYTQDPNVVISTLTGSIAPIEGNTASTNYAVGAYLIHGNQLYRVTSAIATGEAITPGSNCVACTVMGEVIRLTA